MKYKQKEVNILTINEKGLILGCQLSLDLLKEEKKYLIDHYELVRGPLKIISLKSYFPTIEEYQIPKYWVFPLSFLVKYPEFIKQRNPGKNKHLYFLLKNSEYN